MAAVAGLAPGSGAASTGRAASDQPSYTVTFDSKINLTDTNDAFWGGGGTFNYELKSTVPLKPEGPTTYTGSVTSGYAQIAGAFNTTEYGDCGTPTFSETATSAKGARFDAALSVNADGDVGDLTLAPSLNSETGFVSVPTETYHTFHTNQDDTGCFKEFVQDLQYSGWLAGFRQLHLADATGDGCTYAINDLTPGTAANVIAQRTYTTTAAADGYSDGADPCGAVYPLYVFDEGSMTVSEATTVQVIKKCPPGQDAGTITLSEGVAPAKGTVVCQGERIRTGKKGRTELTMPDGSVLRVGPESETEINDVTFHEHENTVQEDFHLFFGKVWTKIESKSNVEIETKNAACGVRGKAPGQKAGRAGTLGRYGSMTVDASDPKYAGGLYHVIKGTGFFTRKGKDFTYDAGLGAYPDQQGLKLTTDWPAADRRLVPSSELPPEISGLDAAGTSAGTKALVTYKLDQPADVKALVVSKQRKVVARASDKGRKGSNSLGLPMPAAGRYDLELYAADGVGRTGSDSKALRVTR